MNNYMPVVVFPHRHKKKVRDGTFFFYFFFLEQSMLSDKDYLEHIREKLVAKFKSMELETGDMRAFFQLPLDKQKELAICLFEENLHVGTWVETLKRTIVAANKDTISSEIEKGNYVILSDYSDEVAYYTHTVGLKDVESNDSEIAVIGPFDPASGSEYVRFLINDGIEHLKCNVPLYNNIVTTDDEGNKLSLDVFVEKFDLDNRLSYFQKYFPKYSSYIETLPKTAYIVFVQCEGYLWPEFIQNRSKIQLV